MAAGQQTWPGMDRGGGGRWRRARAVFMLGFLLERLLRHQLWDLRVSRVVAGRLQNDVLVMDCHPFLWS